MTPQNLTELLKPKYLLYDNEDETYNVYEAGNPLVRVLENATDYEVCRFACKQGSIAGEHRISDTKHDNLEQRNNYREAFISAFGFLRKVLILKNDSVIHQLYDDFDKAVQEEREAM